MPHPSVAIVRVASTVLIAGLLGACSGPAGDGAGTETGTGPVPVAPTDVVATAGPGTLAVDWSHDGDDVTGFAVLRATSDDFDEVAAVASGTATYLDADVTRAFPYVYRVVAIGDGGRSDPSEPTTPTLPGEAGVPVVDPDDPVGVSLNTLGVDTSESDRLGDDGTSLPESYSPLGSTAVLGVEEGTSAPYELFIGGTATSRDGVTSNQVIWEHDASGDAAQVNPMFGLDEEMFDATHVDRAVAGDFDGDGLDELAFVGLAGETHDELTVTVRDDAEDGFTKSETFSVTTREDVKHLSVVSGDFDGNGIATLAVELGYVGGAELLFLSPWADGMIVDRTMIFDAANEEASTSLALATGNVDHDAADELALVISEAFQNASGQDDGLSRYRIFDDANSDFALLDEGYVQGRDGSVHVALVADVGMGDLDGDGRDEVVFGGVTEFHDTCVDLIDLLYVVLDDALSDHAEMGVKLRPVAMGSVCTSDRVKLLRFIHVDLGDVDGDGRDEIVGGPMVFDDWSDPWSELGWIPPTQMYGHGSYDRSGTITADSSALAVLDLDGDGVSEIVYSMVRAERVVRYRLPEDPSDPLVSLTRWGVDMSYSENGSRHNPMLVALNVDADSMVARAIPERTTFTMTEPIIIAALAGAPCYVGTSQNVGACGSKYGEGSSSGIDRSQSVTISASVSIGMKAIGGALTQSEVTAKGTFSVAASYVRSYSYALEKSIAYATGPLEDAVIFTAVPYDQFFYEVVQHPDPDMVGQEVTMSMPREPVTLMVERGYFNRAQADGALQIGDAVFEHVVGEPASYPSVSDRDAILDDLSWRHGRTAVMHGPVFVGQGGGSTEVSIDVSEEVSHGGALEVGFEYEVEAVGASVLTGFSVGVSAEAAFARSSGTSTHYSGSVGNIADESEFARDGYGYGIFAYVHEDPAVGQQFEVINYWVE
ncbi:MAG: fibronectin type III domain-containing protein [Trueperaceae bacterium]